MKWKIPLTIIYSAVLFSAGYYYSTSTSEKKIITKTEIRWKDKIVTRDVTTVSLPECREKLQCYWTSAPGLDANPIPDKPGWISIKASLCEREWGRDIKVGSSGNWNYYIGAGVVGILAGGYITYRLVK